MKFKITLPIFSILLLLCLNLSAQISPGELANVHSSLEGVSNCTKCHSVGYKVTREKCLSCHKVIADNIKAKKGYHASAEVKSKECVACHSDHHGKNFQIIRLNKKTFDHRKTGFARLGAHAKLECKACHKAGNIKDPEIRKKAATTFLGLRQECLACHNDYHQGKMSSKCTDCHSFDTWKNATGFDHSKTRYPLIGKHKEVECAKCHKTEIVNGKSVQRFKGIAFANCVDCHKDPHNNRLGQDCKKCHSEETFHFTKNMKAFDHDKTNFKLLGEHKRVACKLCHKTNMTDPIKHDKCKDCHADFHKKQFAVNNVSPDCDKCHTNDSWAPSTYTIQQHNITKFPLEGAHLATSCLECHKNGKEFNFRNMGSRCVDCHKDEHKGFLEEKFYPNQECKACHNVSSWTKVNFDHDKTRYKLDGAHVKVTCAKCHYGRNADGQRTQQFAGMSFDCSSCHEDSHFGQFAENGKTDCAKCHNTTSWYTTTFNHDNSRFKLEGAHKDVACEECHKTIMDSKGKYVEYKFTDITCAKCHKD